MRIYRSLISAMLIILVSVILIVLSAYYIFTHRPLPRIQGEVMVSGTKEEITIVRDKWGVPHVFAKTREDLFFGSGYVQAQDRLFQMDYIRKASQGRLAEWLGEKAVVSDKAARLMGFSRLAKTNFEKLPAKTKVCLRCYARGINRFTHYRDTNLPVEYKALKQDFEPWKPEDSLAIALYRAFSMSGNFREELVRAMVAAEAGDVKHYQKIIPNELHERYPELLGPPVMESELEPLCKQPFFSSEKAREFLDSERALRRHIGFHIPVKAYDSWAIGPGKTKSGSPLLGSAPHRGFRMPAVWYELHLSGPRIDAVGAVLPGLPVVLAGRNRQFAWTEAPAGADSADLYMVSAPDKGRKAHPAGKDANDFKTRAETISIRTTGNLQRQKVFEVKETSLGPILASLAAEGSSVHLILRWPGHEPVDPVGPYIDICEAHDLESFIAALERHEVPAMNFLYADISGNVVYKMAGKVPQREDHSGMVPVGKYREEHGWKGFIAGPELPEVRNPESGILVSGSIGPAIFLDLFTGAEPGSGHYPALRHHELLSKRAGLTVQDVRDLQLDTVSGRARLLLPHFLKVLEKEKKDSDKMDRAWRQLDDWDGDMRADQAAPTIFAETCWQAFKMTYKDEMSEPVFEAFASFDTMAIIFDLMMENKNARVFDDKSTSAVEDRDDILGRALHESLSVLSRRKGPRMSTWKWENFHRLSLKHPLGEWPLLLKVTGYFEINPEPVGLPGGRDTVNMSYYIPAGGYDALSGSALRFTAGLDNSGSAVFSYAGGQSGQPFSPHYLDIFKLWEKGKGHSSSMDRDDIINNREASLKLIPGEGEY